MGGRSRLLFLTALGALALGGCTPAEAPQPGPVAPGPVTPTAPTGPAEPAGNQSYAREMSAADKAACTSGGGTVQRRGMLGMEMCVYAYADAGRQCTDSAQCEGKCVGSAGSVAPDKAATGQCQADDRLFGCYAEIKGGKSAYAICVD